MKKIIKQMLPNTVKEFITKKRNKPIFNYFSSNYNKKVLLSYIIIPFKKGLQCSHTAYFEAITWAKILDKFGYQIDIINYNQYPNFDISRYDLICGFGDSFEKAIYLKNTKAKMIIYATGMHNCWQNHITLKRLKDVYKKKGVWLVESSRYVNKFYSSHVSFADAVIALGNNFCKESYISYNKNTYQLNAPFFKVIDYKKIIENKKDDFSKHFLWFGSSGAIHKGLDLLLDYFSKKKDIYLHICGNVKNEKEFCKVYNKELFHTENIYYHGFVDITTEKFENILKQCGFVIFPSCSEGGSPSILTCIGNGGLIPIITKETTIDTGYEIWIEDFSKNAIDKSIKKALSYNGEQLIELMYKNGEVVEEKNSLLNYEKNLEKLLNKVIK